MFLAFGSSTPEKGTSTSARVENKNYNNKTIVICSLYVVWLQVPLRYSLIPVSHAESDCSPSPLLSSAHIFSSSLVLPPSARDAPECCFLFVCLFVLVFGTSLPTKYQHKYLFLSLRSNWGSFSLERVTTYFLDLLSYLCARVRPTSSVRALRLPISNLFLYVVGAATLLCFLFRFFHQKWECFCDCRRLRNLREKRTCSTQRVRASLLSGASSAAAGVGSSATPYPSCPPMPASISRPAEPQHRRSASVHGSSLSSIAKKFFTSSEAAEEAADGMTSSFASSGSEGGVPKLTVLEHEMLLRRREKAMEWEEARRGLVQAATETVYARTPSSELFNHLSVENKSVEAQKVGYSQQKKKVSPVGYSAFLWSIFVVGPVCEHPSSSWWYSSPRRAAAVAFKKVFRKFEQRSVAVFVFLLLLYIYLFLRSTAGVEDDSVTNKYNTLATGTQDQKASRSESPKRCPRTTVCFHFHIIIIIIISLLLLLLATPFCVCVISSRFHLDGGVVSRAGEAGNVVSNGRLAERFAWEDRWTLKGANYARSHILPFIDSFRFLFIFLSSAFIYLPLRQSISIYIYLSSDPPQTVLCGVPCENYITPLSPADELVCGDNVLYDFRVPGSDEFMRGWHWALGRVVAPIPQGSADAPVKIQYWMRLEDSKSLSALSSDGVLTGSSQKGPQCSSPSDSTPVLPEEGSAAAAPPETVPYTDVRRLEDVVRSSWESLSNTEWYHWEALFRLSHDDAPEVTRLVVAGIAFLLHNGEKSITPRGALRPSGQQRSLPTWEESIQLFIHPNFPIEFSQFRCFPHFNLEQPSSPDQFKMFDAGLPRRVDYIKVHVMALQGFSYRSALDASPLTARLYKWLVGQIRLFQAVLVCRNMAIGAPPSVEGIEWNSLLEASTSCADVFQKPVAAKLLLSVDPTEIPRSSIYARVHPSSKCSSNFLDLLPHEVQAIMKLSSTRWRGQALAKDREKTLEEAAPEQRAAFRSFSRATSASAEVESEGSPASSSEARTISKSAESPLAQVGPEHVLSGRNATAPQEQYVEDSELPCSHPTHNSEGYPLAAGAFVRGARVQELLWEEMAERQELCARRNDDMYASHTEYTAARLCLPPLPLPLAQSSQPEAGTERRSVEVADHVAPKPKMPMPIEELLAASHEETLNRQILMERENYQRLNVLQEALASIQDTQRMRRFGSYALEMEDARLAKRSTQVQLPEDLLECIENVCEGLYDLADFSCGTISGALIRDELTDHFAEAIKNSPGSNVVEGNSRCDSRLHPLAQPEQLCSNPIEEIRIQNGEVKKLLALIDESIQTYSIPSDRMCFESSPPILGCGNDNSRNTITRAVNIETAPCSEFHSAFSTTAGIATKIYLESPENTGSSFSSIFFKAFSNVQQFVLRYYQSVLSQDSQEEVSPEARLTEELERLQRVANSEEGTSTASPSSINPFFESKTAVLRQLRSHVIAVSNLRKDIVQEAAGVLSSLCALIDSTEFEADSAQKHHYKSRLSVPASLRSIEEYKTQLQHSVQLDVGCSASIPAPGVTNVRLALDNGELEIHFDVFPSYSPEEEIEAIEARIGRCEYPLTTALLSHLTISLSPSDALRQTSDSQKLQLVLRCSRQAKKPDASGQGYCKNRFRHNGMAPAAQYGMAVIIVTSCFFVVSAGYIFWWIIAGELMNKLLQPGTMGPLDPFIALGSVKYAGNLNVTNIGFSLVYVALLVLIIIVDGLLANITDRIQHNGKLPPLSLVQHYQDTGYTAAVSIAGTAQKWRKVVVRQPAASAPPPGRQSETMNQAVLVSERRNDYIFIIYSTRLLLAVTLSVRGRFVPPWERDGKTAADFFQGLMQSKNPIQQLRKDRRVMEEQLEQEVFEARPPEELRRAEEAQRAAEERRRQRRAFLPYGAAPRQYFDSSKMAAWGEYQQHLQASTVAEGAADGYSQGMTQLLAKDLDEKVPYQHNACPPRQAGACQWPFHGTAGVVLDIDGVVYRSKKIIPGSDDAVKKLLQLRVPFLFMTNGGGVTEETKAAELSRLLECDIDPEQIIMSHTPMKLLAPMFKRRTVLIGGGRDGEEVARRYGFDHPISIERFQCEHPELVPFKNWAGLERAAPHSIPFPSIAAVLTFSDLLDVMSDVQVILDVLLAPHGRIGTAVSASQTVPYYHCADDLLWATEAPLPRLGGGAIREMLTASYQCVAGENLQVVMYGKPRAIAYTFAEQQLKKVSERMGWDPSSMRSIYMVGDNTETDIMGANAAGGLWTSVHVLSGIGAAPAAQRTLIQGDEEQIWLERCVSKVPHYVAPTLDHFIRELLSFPETAINAMKKPYYGELNPVDLRETYNCPV
eukprot:gene6137-4417_t